MRSSTRLLPRSRMLQWSRNGLATVLAAWAIYWLHQHAPTYAERFAPIPVRGVVGQPARARGFTVEIPQQEALTAGRTLLVASILGRPQRIPTTGIWLSVPVRLESTLDQEVVSAFLRDAQGRQYMAIDRGGVEAGDPFTDGVARGLVYETNLHRNPLAPGFAQSGRLYFEVPANALPGLHAQFYLGRVMLPNDHLVDIDLAIDNARAQALRKAAADELRTYTLHEVRR